MMRKNVSLLIVLILAFFGIGTAQETKIVTIGTVPTDFDNSNLGIYSPVHTGSDYSFVENLYRANEITSNGGVKGIIKSISFYAYQGGQQDKNVVVYMKNVLENSFSNNGTDWFSVSNNDIVYSGTWSISNNTEWQTITLDKAFEWNGNNNLLIAFDDNTGSHRNLSFVYKATDSNSVFRVTDSSDIDPSSPGSGYASANRAIIQMTIVPTPVSLAASNITSNSASLSWTENGTATSWQICLNNDETNLINATANPHTLSGLTAATTYSVKVRSVYDTSYSAWSDAINFTTEQPACLAPTNLTTNDITCSYAEIQWEGESDSYVVELGALSNVPTAYLMESFDGDTIPTGWSIMGLGSTNWNISESSIAHAGGTPNQLYLYCEPFFDGVSRFVSPVIDLTGLSSIKVSFKHYLNNDQNSSILGIATSSDYGDTWHTGWSQEYDESGQYTVSETISTADMGQPNVQFCIYFEGNTYNLTSWTFDDIEIGENTTITTWTQVGTTTETSYALRNLDLETSYQVRVKGVCSEEESDYSSTISFTTEATTGKTFIHEGDWNVASNWSDGTVPVIIDDVTLAADATIPADVVGTANKITSKHYTLTIADGGQLRTKNKATVTMQKNVKGYGNANANTNNGYILIGNPTTTTCDPSTAGLTTGNYDLYQFDGTPSEDDEDDLEWKNYEATPFDMSNSTGYLYANEADATLNFTGEIYPNFNTSMSYSATEFSDSEFGAWQAYANPFACNAYLNTSYSSLAFYRMNSDGNGFIAATGTIAPMEGVFVKYATDYDNFSFTTTSPQSTSRVLNINLSKAARTAKVTDRAIIRFDEGNKLEKFSFSDDTPQVYIPQDGTDYAVVTAGNIGELPVNFKAESNGSYTLSFDNEEVEFSYLHLIDNLTGADVDLLINPSYSFEAKTTDYASRFKLVFATGSSTQQDDFAFVSNGHLKIYGIEGNAILKVMDLTGRTISTESFNGSYDKALNLSTGVYMLQLIQGPDIKTQKIVL